MEKTGEIGGKASLPTRRGVELHEINPFMPKPHELNKKVKKITNRNKKMALVDLETKKLEGQAGFWEGHEVDATQFVKLYINGVKALAELTSAGTKVFALLYEEMQKNIGGDKIYLSYASPNTKKIMSESVFRKGLKELLNKKFIAACIEPNFYWINPSYIFNGNRLAFVKEYHLRPSKKEYELTSKENDDQQSLPFKENNPYNLTEDEG